MQHLRTISTNRGKYWLCSVALPLSSDDSGKRKGFRQNRTHARPTKVAKDAIMQIASSNRRYCASSATYYLKKRAVRAFALAMRSKAFGRGINFIRVIFALFRDAHVLM